MIASEELENILSLIRIIFQRELVIRQCFHTRGKIAPKTNQKPVFYLSIKNDLFSVVLQGDIVHHLHPEEYQIPGFYILYIFTLMPIREPPSVDTINLLSNNSPYQLTHPSAQSSPAASRMKTIPTLTVQSDM